MPTGPAFIWYQMNTTMEGGFVTGLGLDFGFIDVTVD